MELNIDFEICSFIFISIFFLAFNVKSDNDDGHKDRINMLMTVVLSTMGLEIITAQMLNNALAVALPVKWVFCTVFLVVLVVIPSFYTRLIYSQTKHPKKRKLVFELLNLVPCLLCAVAVATSFLSNYVFYIDEDGLHSGKLFLICHLNFLLYAFVSLRYSYFSKAHLDRRRFLSVVFMLGSGLAAMLVSAAAPNTPVYTASTSIALMLICIYTQEGASRTDSISNALTREAFFKDLDDYAQSDYFPRILVAALDNFKIVNELYGVDGGNELMREFTQKLKEEYGAANIYRFNGDIFNVIITNDTDSRKVVDVMQRVLSSPFYFKGMDVRLSACVCLIQSQHHKGEAIISAIEYAVMRVKEKGKGQFYELHEDSVEILKRQKAIEQAVVQNLNEGHFEVHYQPIFDTKKRKFHSLEALARLNVPDYGYISPEEFIKICEKNGTILQIGRLVLEEVCKFVSESKIKQKGIEFVEVNLSVVQCMEDKIYDEVKGILAKYSIPAEMINLEITESAAAYSEKMLIQNMARMSLMSITFSLDDYGSGYSNINYLVDLPFSIAKIDKYVVWAAQRSATSKMILQNIISMFKDINLKVVAEGIETAETADMVTKMGADYLQGYYYSKPVAKDKLMGVLEESYLGRMNIH